MNERSESTKGEGIAKLSSRNWRKRKGNFSPRIKRREAKKDRKGWNRMGRIYQTDYTIKIRRRFNKSENHWVSMLDQPASGGLIKYNPHPPPSNVVAPLVARVKRAIFLAKKKTRMISYPAPVSACQTCPRSIELLGLFSSLLPVFLRFDRFPSVPNESKIPWQRSQENRAFWKAIISSRKKWMLSSSSTKISYLGLEQGIHSLGRGDQVKGISYRLVTKKERFFRRGGGEVRWAN